MLVCAIPCLSYMYAIRQIITRASDARTPALRETGIHAVNPARNASASDSTGSGNGGRTRKD